MRRKQCARAFVNQLHSDWLPTNVGRLAEKQFDATHEATCEEVGEAHGGAFAVTLSNFARLDDEAAEHPLVQPHWQGQGPPCCIQTRQRWGTTSVQELENLLNLRGTARKAHEFLARAGHARERLQLQPKNFNGFGGVEFEVERSALPGHNNGDDGHCR